MKASHPLLPSPPPAPDPSFCGLHKKVRQAEATEWGASNCQIIVNVSFKHPVIIHPTSPLMYITIIYLCFCILPSLPSLQYFLYFLSEGEICSLEQHAREDEAA
jgi:hypothetical protein